MAALYYDTDKVSNCIRRKAGTYACNDVNSLQDVYTAVQYIWHSTLPLQQDPPARRFMSFSSLSYTYSEWLAVARLHWTYRLFRSEPGFHEIRIGVRVASYVPALHACTATSWS